jgi:transposase, IS30 family
VPGHWEGDLIIGKDNASAIGTLVERATRYVLLLKLPKQDRSAEQVRDAMIIAMRSLPAALRRSMTWDQGREMSRHAEISMALGMPVYFCDPHSPWQRGSNENTNGLLRQYFPKGTDLSVHTAQDLAAVADELNDRPRQTLGWDSPAERMRQLLSDPATTGVATTP